MSLRRNLNEKYSPLYFLASLGNGGLVITFFMFLMFMVPHPKTPIPTFDALQTYLAKAGALQQGLVVLAIAGIIFFAFRHLRMLAWNFREYRRFKRVEAYSKLRSSNAEVTLMAIPLTLGMSMNVLFVIGAVLVPGLWSVVELLFPVALLAFGAIGFYALKVFFTFFSRILTRGNFDCAANNNLSQMLAMFAFAMLAVGFAASAAMSHVTLTATVGAVGAVFFLSISVLLAMVKMVLGFRAMLERGVSKEASMSLWIIIPILTLWGITTLRLNHGFHHLFHGGLGKGGLFLLTAGFVSLQLFFGVLGYTVMKKLGYFKDYVHGASKSPGAYALICPGVALFVFGMFFLNVGLVKTGLLPKFSVGYFVLLTPLLYLQFKTITTVFRLDRKLLRAERREIDKAQAQEA